MAGSSEKITVLNPVGYPPVVTRKQEAPRLESLNGKVVYLVDDRFDDSDRFLKQLQGWMQEQLPEVETRLVRLNSVYHHDDPATWEMIQQNGDAAIVGVGH
jgi:hypothetical protein